MAYATGTDLVDCFDVDLVGDLAQDTREPVDASSVKTLPNVLRMLDQASGETLWKFKTSSGINSPPITYTHNGRQYVTVLSGIGGVLNRVMKAADGTPTGGSVWTFAVMPN